MQIHLNENVYMVISQHENVYGDMAAVDWAGWSIPMGCVQNVFYPTG